MSLERGHNIGVVWSWNLLSKIFRPVLSPLAMRAFAKASTALVIVFVLHSVSLSATSPMPGEENSGFFYTLTHLPFFAYLVLFTVLCLSVVNLFFQSKLSKNWKVAIPFLGSSKLAGTKARFTSSLDRLSHYKSGKAVSINGSSNQPSLDDGIVAVRSLKSPGDEMELLPPTPLEGTNHSLPNFGSSKNESFTEEPDEDSAVTNSSTIKDFRFCSAVDRPSDEELQRREKERLIVTGHVRTTDGNALGSAIVYLSDSEGNKVGQSCRSNSESGAFKVIGHETGSYWLNAYKRGYAMQSSPNSVPAESGRVDGLDVTLISEGCLVHGRAIVESEPEAAQNLLIKCVCRSENFSGTSTIDDEGNYRLSNIPMNSECYLEAIDQDGTVLTRTEPFQTVHKKKLCKDIQIPSPLSVELDESAEVLNPFIESKGEDFQDETTLRPSIS